MPASTPSSNDSPTRYPDSREPERREEPGAPSEGPDDDERSRSVRDWRRAATLFILTIGSVFYTAWGGYSLKEAAQFTGALLAILVTHELGHWIAARIHRVPASPPFFIPMPILSPFGTMGAIIRMSARIPTRKALLDIGASGPLAGLVVAIPMYLWGAAHSRFVPLDTQGALLGESILIKVLDRIAAGPAPAGMQLELSSVAYAAWGGLFVTMINLLPVGQLDGGHVAYSLFGSKQDRYAAFVHRALLALFFVNLASFVFRDARAGLGFGLIPFGRHIGSSLFWFVWFEVLIVLGSLSAETPHQEQGLTMGQRLASVFGLIGLVWFGQWRKAEGIFWMFWFVGLALVLLLEVKGGALRRTSLFDHPPTGAAPLGIGRKVVAVVTLLFFVLLFMPTPIAF